jgi:hypothetical protein
MQDQSLRTYRQPFGKIADCRLILKFMLKKNQVRAIYKICKIFYVYRNRTRSN